MAAPTSPCGGEGTRPPTFWIASTSKSSTVRRFPHVPGWCAPACPSLWSFVQAVNSTDTATQMEALELNVSELMTDNAILVDFAPVVGILPPSTRPLPASSSPFHPTVTLVTVVSSGGMETAAIAVSVVCVLVVAVVMLVVVAMLIIMNKRKLLCWEKKRETGGIGNTLYMLTGADGGKVCSGPIYEDPAVTLSHKPKPPELDYEVDPNLWNGTNWAQSYDVVTVAHPASHRKRQSLEENEEQEYRYSRPHPLEGTYAVSGEVAVTTPTYSSPTTHHYHILEQVVKGEHVYKDMSPFREPPVHVNELYAELSKFNITKIPKDEITITGPLGTGHFSFVSRGVWKDAQGVAREVAIKSLACTDPMSKVKFLQEAVIMGQFKHPSVVQLCGSMMEGDTVQLVIEYLHNGDLAKHLQQMKSKPEDLASPRGPTMLLEFCQQVAFGMHYLATKGFIHRDLAARNVLVSQDGVCKIADFGLSRDLASEDYYVSKGGAIPIKWTAPEAIHYKKYSTASDVWSYGCLLYEIWSVGHKPFEFQSNLEVIQKVSSGYRLPPPPGCPRAIYKLMVSCWNPDSILRPQFREILAILIGHNGTVLSIPDDIVSTGSHATSLGAPLESAVTLYTDLQTMYSVHISS
eukprot:Em0011g690a